jgi:cytochrome P450
MTATETDESELYYDPFDFEIDADPYPIWRRLRDERPVYYNERYDFYALSRFADVERALVDWRTYSSAKGTLLEIIKSDMEIPPGSIIFEDPPNHDLHRGLLSRVFTPRKMNAIEPKVREFCAASLDPLVGSGKLDFVRDLGAQMPMRVIGMLLGIPEADQETIRDSSDAALRTEPGKPMRYSQQEFATGAAFADYIDWRADHPSDDLMTELLTAEFEDETGTTRRLTREEVLTYVNVVAGAGNETTTRLIGWAGKVLGDHPDQRRELVEDRSLIPNAVEELLRYEPITPFTARLLHEEVEYRGVTFPADTVVMVCSFAGNRDGVDGDPEAFDITADRGDAKPLTFGAGIHYCLGAPLARVELQVSLGTLVDRFGRLELAGEPVRRAEFVIRGLRSLPVTVDA